MQLEETLATLKKQGFPAYKIEKELSLTSGTISRMLNGKQKIDEGIIANIQGLLGNKSEVPSLKIQPEKSVREVKVSRISPETQKKLNDAVSKINKDFGEGSVMSMTGSPVKAECISTGSFGLDSALGIGGLPKGRIIEIYGPESSGKTTIALHTISQAQKLGGKCAFIDAEHSFDAVYATNIGIDVADLLISQPDYGEQALEIADQLINTGAISVIVIDSVAALVPKGELEGDMGDSKMGLHARLMSQAMRKMTASVHRTGVILIFINQLREKIGVMFGNPETTTGGNALKFYASVRLDVRRIGQIKDGENVIGNRVKVKVVKNKVSPPFKVTEFDLMYGSGIDSLAEIIDIAVERGIIDKSGSWFSYEGDKLGQGKSAVKQVLSDNPSLISEIKTKILSNQKP